MLTSSDKVIKSLVGSGKTMRSDTHKLVSRDRARERLADNKQDKQRIALTC